MYKARWCKMATSGSVVPIKYSTSPSLTIYKFCLFKELRVLEGSKCALHFIRSPPFPPSFLKLAPPTIDLLISDSAWPALFALLYINMLEKGGWKEDDRWIRGGVRQIDSCDISPPRPCRINIYKEVQIKQHLKIRMIILFQILYNSHSISLSTISVSNPNKLYST